MKAQSILQEGSGSQWDPDIVEAFFANLDKVQTVSTCHEDSDTLVESILPAVTGK